MQVYLVGLRLWTIYGSCARLVPPLIDRFMLRDWKFPTFPRQNPVVLLFATWQSNYKWNLDIQLKKQELRNRSSICTCTCTWILYQTFYATFCAVPSHCEASQNKTWQKLVVPNCDSAPSITPFPPLRPMANPIHGARRRNSSSLTHTHIHTQASNT